ncbi:MAG: hypothetical protein KDD04_06605 [Sinomicrobium sp.]|nr:hypothetical protein [Sinomicrobium sp.]
MTHQQRSDRKVTKDLLNILSKTTLCRDGNTKKVFSRAIRKAFDATDSREEAETLVVLAHKYNLSCLEDMLNDLDCIPELPF